MDSRAEIKASLSSIEFHLDEVKIFDYFVSKGIITDRPYDAALKFREFKTQFEKYSIFFDEDLLNILNLKLKEAMSPLITLDIRDFWFHDTTLDKLNKTIDYLEKLPNLKLEKFNFSPEITINDLKNLLSDISEKINIVDDLDLTNFLKKIPSENLEECARNLIQVHNTLYASSTQDPDIINDCYQYFKELKKNIELEQLNEKISTAQDKLIEVRAETGKNSNKKLGEIFKTESEALKCMIRIYTVVIISTFLTLICFLIYFIYNSAVLDKYKFPSDNHFYYFYISLILIITGFLTFIIKERTRLVNHAHYCKISYLEIHALSDYCSELEEKSKIDELKIKLADRYFRGPNPIGEVPSDINNVSLITSKLSEISKAVQEVKSAIK
ncbi:hypothetical protein ACS125_15090 [Acinetobacter sp. PFS20]|uniref:hypothetical protein n=1 Tax=Acinetobacter sp. PFS20 TaxID=3458434 RepID=UPI003FD201EE